MSITDKMGKNGQLSVKIQTFLIRFYGQMLQKWHFVRKMRFGYGQIIKKRHFVCKFEWNLGWITDKSMKIGRLSVNGSLEKCRLRTKWSKMAVCP